MTTIKHGLGETFVLPAMQTMQVAVPAGARGRISYLSMSDGAPATGWRDLSPSETLVWGPYGRPTRYKVESFDNTITVTIGVVDPIRAPVSATSFVELFGAVEPVDGAQATLSRNPTGDDNALTFTAVAYGVAGNDISIAYLDPGANNATLSVSVNGKYIAVNLATDGSGVITSTAAEVLAAIEASLAASTLVTVEINAADSGSGDDGSGIVTALARAYMTGGAGTGVGVAGPGSRYTDEVAGALYINTGTLAAPVWELATTS